MAIDKKNNAIDFEAIFESMPGQCLLLDTDFKIINASDAYLQATMVERNKIIGKGAFEVFPDNPADEAATGVKNVRASLEKVLKNKIADTMAIQKYDIRRPVSRGGDFEERYWSIVNTPVLSKQGAVKYIIHRAEDVTEFIHLKQTRSEQLKIMDALRTRAGEMEIEIYRRAQEIQVMNQQLQEANRHLFKLDQLKTQFFANVSHELRTPLMLILGPLEQLLLNQTLSPEQTHNLQLIQSNARLLLKHVNDLLEIAKLDAGKMTLNYANVDLVKLVEQIVSLFESRTQVHELFFSINAPEQILAQLDLDKIQRVLINLISNAVKFSPPKSCVKLTLTQHSERARITIEDSGPGIPPELCEAIFERFFQVEESTTRTMGGTGLGLAIAKDLIELHAGTISVTNAKQGGARFTIDLPLNAPADATVEVEPHLLPVLDEEIALSLPEGKPPKIAVEELNHSTDTRPLVLVVEDNRDMNLFLCKILSETYRVESAFDGKQGLEKALQSHPDLIVSDIMMPNMNGAEMVHELRQEAELLTTPVIILTAKADDELCVRMLREGAQDYMIKPFLAGEFKARVANLLLAKKAEDELERFVYLASHDLKAPLPAMEHLISWIEEDLGEQIAEQSKKHLKLLRGRAQRMSNLLDGLLHYSRAGKACKVVSRVDTKQLVTDIVNELNPPAAFVFKYADNLPIIKTAEQPLHDVFAAIIGNSIKHHDRNKAIIEIGVNEQNGFYEFFVSDDGPGIEPEYHDRIFKLFQTLQSRDVLEASGVGLSIAKKIVESQGGKIGVDSEKNHGATFRFTWPKRLPSEMGHAKTNR